MSRKRKSDVDSAEPPVAETWSRTEQYKVKGRHQWTIDDFLRRANCTEVGDSLCSPIFGVPVETQQGKTQELMFQLEVFPNGEEGEDNSDYVAVFLTSRRQGDLEVKYDFSVLKADNTCWGRIGNTFKKFSPDQNSWGYGKAFSKAKLQEKAGELLPGGRLTIVCNLEIYHSDRNTMGKKIKIEQSTPPEYPELGSSLGAACLSPDYADMADVTLICESRTFPCHKVILSTRSDVFKAMFSHNETKEGQTNRVEIEDTDAATLEQLIKFMYTDKVDEASLAELASSLLRAADKYNIPKLKFLCEEAICKNLDVANAAEALILAHLHEASHLKDVVVDFVTSNFVKVSETAEWTNITNSHPKVLAEILTTVMSKVRQMTMSCNSNTS